ncbi:MAG: tRNA pseudouridine(55) synthase TruB [Alphaproteobacteria bacterium]|nr:tRNA pseudouridine(55) synthase TruB [Alphaproteobacteria bacterium]
MSGAEGERLDGWLVVDKPLGLTSTAIVGRIRRAAGGAKVGHGGTLDPLATGVLPIALGEATKTVGWAMSGAKTYRMVIGWGEERSTDDREGAVTATSAARPTAADIAAALPAFEGEIMQVPPAFSAIKVGGRRSYAIARARERAGADAPPALAARPVRIDAIRLLAARPDEAELEVACGKGVYMRSLARDLAHALGTCGHVASLRRLSVGSFDLSRAISLEEETDLCNKAAILAHLLPVATALDDIPALALTEAEAERLRHGVTVLPGRADERIRLDALGEGTVVSTHAGGRLVAMAEIRGGALRPVRVMNL